ncbi:MAG: T9SS type A sorting domain-containing protein [Flavobacteriales bacterium]|jgi:hypothetical protein
MNPFHEANLVLYFNKKVGMGKNVLIVLTSMIFWVSLAQGQEYVRSVVTPEVTVDGYSLKYPWAGGLNSPQFSEMDVNFDGLLDVLAFDRTANRLHVFENTGTDYMYTREYDNRFPGGMTNWVVARDFNCDGKMDLATSVQSGFIIYPNVGDAENGLNFDILTTPNINNLQLATFDFDGNPFTAPVFVFSIDMPNFVDHDNDGDMDLITFTELSSTVYYFKNMAVENGNCSVPEFICANRCYGYFSESIESFQIFFGSEAECQFNVVDPRSAEFWDEHMAANERLHAGGTLLSIDLDGNGLKDLIMSDVTESNLASFMMEPSTEGRDSVVAAYFNFPSIFDNTIAADMDVFPAGYYLDIDFDGVKDLLVSPNTTSESSDVNSVWYYSNEGVDSNPDFLFVRNNQFQRDMIDLGTGAHPAFVDIDNDGLLDLFITNRKYYDESTLITSKIAYYRNIGSETYPEFELLDDNYLNMPSFNWRSVHTAFGDLDGDGDKDIVVGNLDGNLHLFTNQGSEDVPNFVYSGAGMNDNTNTLIDVGQSSTPFFVDINEDGLLDMLVGEKNGNINYYRNIGTSNAPVFTLQDDSFGGIVATSFLGIDGFSVPYAYKNALGNWEILCGSETGGINQYEVSNNDLTSDFGLITEEFAGINEGNRCTMAFGDITGDGVDDLAYGHSGGGVAMFLSEEIDVSVNEVETQSFVMFPNPVERNEITIQLNQQMSKVALIEIFDAIGRRVQQEPVTGNRMNIRLRLVSGVYIVKIGNQSERLIVR